RDPDGHRTELLLPGIQIIDIDDEPMMCPVKPNANSNLWGLPAPKSGVEEETNFKGVQVNETPHGSPMTAERYLAEKKKEAAGEGHSLAEHVLGRFRRISRAFLYHIPH